MSLISNETERKCDFWYCSNYIVWTWHEDRGPTNVRLSRATLAIVVALAAGCFHCYLCPLAACRDAVSVGICNCMDSNLVFLNLILEWYPRVIPFHMLFMLIGQTSCDFECICCMFGANWGLLIWHFWPRPAQDVPEGPDCETGYHDWEHQWNEQQRAYCCQYAGRACSQEPNVIHKVIHVPVVQKGHNHYVPVPVPSPPHVVYKTHVVRLPPKVIYHTVHETNYDCHAGYSNWYFGWSARKKSWCCDQMAMGCTHTHVMAHGVGHAHGRIYDCDAGFSRWMTGWSDSKKDWCCQHQSRGCVKFHCAAGSEARLDISWHALHHHPYISKLVLGLGLSDCQWFLHLLNVSRWPVDATWKHVKLCEHI